MEPNNKLSTEVSEKGIDPVLFFHDNSDFVLAYKKTEKLSSAVYMVTGLFSDNEPMKWNLRKKVGELLSFILMYKDILDGGKADFVDKTKTKTLELISLLEVSFRGALLSEMNFAILKQEFLNLISILNQNENILKPQNGERVEGLSREFFTVSQSLSNIKDNPNSFLPNEISARNSSSKMSFMNIKDKNEENNNSNRSNRQEVILALIKKKKELTIKDISAVIRDCSEKTIQRELNSFISSGVLKRAGVRRWSKYSLA